MPDAETENPKMNIGQEIVEKITAMPDISETSEERARKKIARIQAAARKMEEKVLQQTGHENDGKFECSSSYYFNSRPLLIWWSSLLQNLILHKQISGTPLILKVALAS
jgi:hypothetical protein